MERLYQSESQETAVRQSQRSSSPPFTRAR
jgi:hypothetical protein